MQARSIHLSSFDNMFNDRLTVDLQMWTGINVANFSFCRLLCYASIFMCIIWFRSHTVSTFLILTMQEQTAELKLHWWFEFIRLKKMGNDDKDGDGSATSKRQHLTNTLHFEQTELTHFMLSAAAEPLCTTVRKKICFCPGHTDSNSTRSLAGSWTHSCKIFHSSFAGKGADSGLMSKWQQCNSADLQRSCSWFTPVQESVPACSRSPSLVCSSQLWFFMSNNKKILLSAQLLQAWRTEQNCGFGSPRASCWGACNVPMLGCVQCAHAGLWCPSHHPQAGNAQRRAAFLVPSFSLVLWRECVPMSREENISSSAHINVWAYTASSINLLVVPQYIINLRQ